ncbi:MAG: OmpW family outer membrane protein [Marinobacter sp.]|uniref:OmpW/AlkL family protein n=1 Tax=Marinobacter sp. TaxID=50741 RepID=UPI00299EFD4E|nr:OmpW family outer membrane protein [Marinobacter sp.]MDX1634596.1 OmpW family outer membrane protein [Marinobacter sp.]
MPRSFRFSLLAASVLAAPLANAYDAGDLVLRAGVAAVDPQDSSNSVRVGDTVLTGWEVNVDSNRQLGLTASYLLTDHIGVGLLAATPFKHNIRGDGAALAGAGKLAETKHLPPTLTLQYYPLAAGSRFQPYAGLGVNYTLFFEERTTPTLTGALGAASTTIELDDSVGVAAELGLDVALDDRFGINAAIWWVDIDTEATIRAFDGAGDLAATGTVDVEIDPLVYMVGFSYRF